MSAITETDLPQLALYRRGKVRDIHELDDRLRRRPVTLPAVRTCQHEEKRSAILTIEFAWARCLPRRPRAFAGRLGGARARDSRVSPGAK